MFKFIFLLFIPLSLCALFDPTTHIILVRHGETFRSAEGKEIQGWIDDDAAQLNPKGQAQADQLSQKLAKRYQGILTAIYSSPLGRCLQTAQAISTSFPDIPLIEDRHFMEICHGQHDTMPPKERDAFCLKRYAERERNFKEKYPDKIPDRFFKWAYNPLVERQSPSDAKFEGDLETILQLFERATEGCRILSQKHPGETILISSHAGLIKTLANEAEYRQRGDENPLPVYYEHPISSTCKSQYLPGNCSIYHFIWKEGTLTFTGKEDLD